MKAKTYKSTNNWIAYNAIIFDVKQLTTKEISNLINLLIASHFPKYVQTNPDFQNNYKNFFQHALAIWNINFNQDNILAKGYNLSFFVSIKYKSIKFRKPTNAVSWSNL